MQYADGLAQSVQNHEISEAVALQRFAEYKTKMFQAIRHDEAIVAAGEAAKRPQDVHYDWRRRQLLLTIIPRGGCGLKPFPC